VDVDGIAGDPGLIGPDAVDLPRGSLRFQRARATLGYILATTFGNTEAATALIERVKHIHSYVHGIQPDGVQYARWTRRRAGLASSSGSTGRRCGSRLLS